MTKPKQIALYIVVAAVALAAGFLGRSVFVGGNGNALTAEAAQKGAAAIFATSLPDLENKPQAMSQWRGKVLVVNFWATWCAPCRKEIPEFVQMQKTLGGQGLLFVGIALDQPVKVAAFAKEMGINYPVLVGGWETLELAKGLGNAQSVLPFTVVFDKSGNISATHLGGLNQTQLDAMVKPLL